MRRFLSNYFDLLSIFFSNILTYNFFLISFGHKCKNSFLQFSRDPVNLLTTFFTRGSIYSTGIDEFLHTKIYESKNMEQRPTTARKWRVLLSISLHYIGIIIANNFVNTAKIVVG